jgi:molybdenum-dependent DNA-binding transcriptional regulator ModE
MAHSAKKTERMRKQTMQNLKKIAESGSLSSAAAQYEIYRRAAKDEQPRT